MVLSMRTDDMGAPALEIVDLVVEYHGVPALRGVTFSVPARRIVAVLGPNGAGKSTLANSVSGLVKSTGGVIRLGGQDITPMPAYERHRRGIGHLPDLRGIFPSLTVGENLKMGLFVRGSKRRTRESIEQALGIFPILGARQRQKAGLLSGGEQQMLAMARLLVHPPAVLVVDEVSHGLAPKIVDSLFSAIASLRTQTSVLLIEQFIDRALECADSAIVLRGGSVVHQAQARDLSRSAVQDLYSLGGSATGTALDPDSK
jgi:branched-chain amino acid transport system ATP-binding protein